MIISQKKYKMYSNNDVNHFGFTIIEVMIILSIIAIVASIATPNIKHLVHSYKLRMASTDLISYMNMAKIRATKQNDTWTINFAPFGFSGYEVFYTDENGKHVVAKVNFNTCNSKSNYTKCYNNDINFNSPSLSETCDTTEFQFNPNGLTNIGCMLISNKEHTGYYRVGLLAASGIIRTQKWNGTSWE
jgi:prepilin-type N-terminal cleavage/methylation domain-containing protein